MHGVPAIAFGFAKAKDGGDEGDRTPGLVVANDALYQLSYIPLANEQHYPTSAVSTND